MMNLPPWSSDGPFVSHPLLKPNVVESRDYQVKTAEGTWKSLDLEASVRKAGGSIRSEIEHRTALAKVYSRAVLWAITMSEAVRRNASKDSMPPVDRNRLTYTHLRKFLEAEDGMNGAAPGEMGGNG